MQFRWIAIGVMCFSAALLSACGGATGNATLSSRSSASAMSKSEGRHDASRSDKDDCDESEGLICKVRQGHRSAEVPLGEIEVKKGDPNEQLVADYKYWFWNYR